MCRAFLLLLVGILHSKAIFSFNLNQAHLYYAGALFSWFQSIKTKNELIKFEYELGGLILGGCGLIKQIIRAQSFSCSSLHDSDKFFQFLNVGSIIIALIVGRATTPLPSAIAASLMLHELCHKAEADGMGLSFRPRKTCMNDLQYLFGLIVIASSFTRSKTAAQSILITDKGLQGSMLTLGAYMVVDAMTRQYVSKKL